MHLPPSRAPQTLRPTLPTMFILSPRRNIRRADYLRRLRVIEAIREAMKALAVEIGHPEALLHIAHA